MFPFLSPSFSVGSYFIPCYLSKNLFSPSLEHDQNKSISYNRNSWFQDPFKESFRGISPLASISWSVLPCSRAHYSERGAYNFSAERNSPTLQGVKECLPNLLWWQVLPSMESEQSFNFGSRNGWKWGLCISWFIHQRTRSVGIGH